MIEYSWNSVQTGCEAIAYKIKKDIFTPDMIVGLTRGGLIPAVIMSHCLDIPMIPVSYSSNNGKGEYKQYKNDLPTISLPITSGVGNLRTPSLLIVDDICDSGNTMKEITQHYIQRGHLVYTAALHYKKSSVFKPDFLWKTIEADAPWILYPWEK